MHCILETALKSSRLFTSGEPTIRPECSRGVGTEPSGSKLEVGGETSEDEVRVRISRKPASWTLTRVGFRHIYHSCSLHLKSEFSKVFCTSADKDLPVRCGLHEISTGVEGEIRVQRMKATVGRSLVPLFEGHRHRDPAVPVLIENRLCLKMLLMKLLFWLTCGSFQFVSPFGLLCTLFSFIEQFVADLASIANNSTGHQLVSFCRSA